MNDALLSTIVERLRNVPGVQAVVLGGSRGHGRGTAKPDSDYDIGLYFDSPDTFDIAALNTVAKAFDDEHRDDLCTPVGGWGPWVVGGGWLQVDGAPVDFIYRELPRVQRVVQACVQGEVTVGYQAGHPYGFVSSIYAGEVATCQILWEQKQSNEGVRRLKAQLEPYPVALKKAIIDTFAWEAGFCAAIARKPAQRGDVAYVHGALFRAVMCMTQILFALNAQWWLNEKSAVALAATFAHTPSNYAERVNEMFASQPLQAIEMLIALDNEQNRLIVEHG
jgi:hypothetical protein